MTQSNRKERIVEYLTKKELATLFKISTRTIDRWRASRINLGAIKIGRVVRFNREKVEALLNQRTR
jgi:excisionase family DNA binding protein